jgi:GAF domain-containing protein
MSKSLAAELEVLASSLTTGDEHNSQFSIPSLAERIAKTFDVKPDEVAILAISEKLRHLYFLVPQALRNVGQIPLSSTNALAARNVRDNRAEMINNFTNVRHASVFEGVKSEELTASVIQRILSAPISAGGKVIGIIQVSRKAQKLAEAGPEFTPEDLRKLQALCPPLGKLIQRVLTA